MVMKIQIMEMLMWYITLGLSLSLANLQNPFTCMCKSLCTRADEQVVEDAHTDVNQLKIVENLIERMESLSAASVHGSIVQSRDSSLKSLKSFGSGVLSLPEIDEQAEHAFIMREICKMIANHVKTIDALSEDKQ